MIYCVSCCRRSCWWSDVIFWCHVVDPHRPARLSLVPFSWCGELSWRGAPVEDLSVRIYCMISWPGGFPFPNPERVWWVGYCFFTFPSSWWMSWVHNRAILLSRGAVTYVTHLMWERQLMRVIFCAIGRIPSAHSGKVHLRVYLNVGGGRKGTWCMDLALEGQAN
jgi:hypothetical protein